jgi:PAS domain S-box-containing protein
MKPDSSPNRFGRSGEREKRLAKLLMAIRNINRLITRENAPLRLIDGACQNLTRTLGFENTWILLVDEEHRITASAHSGFGTDCEPLKDLVLNNRLPLCAKKALSDAKPVAIRDPKKECTDCPFLPYSLERPGIVFRMECEDRVFGILRITIPVVDLDDAETIALLEDLSLDIGFALKKIESENLHRAAETKRNHYARIVAANSDYCCLLDRDCVYQAVNPAYENIAGRPASEIEGRTVEQILGADFFKREMKPHLEKCFRGQSVSFCTWRHIPDLKKRYLHVSYSPCFAPDGTVSAAAVIKRDVTALWNTENRLRESERLLQETGKMARVGGWEIDLETDRVSWSETTRAIHEVPPDYEPILEKAIDFFAPEHRRLLAESIRRAREEGTSYDLELRFITAKGRKLWTRAVCKPEFRDGKCTQLHGTFQDITEKKTWELELLESEQKHRLLAENTLDVIWTMDLDFTITYVNPAVERSFGYTPAEFIGTKLDRHCSPEDFRRIRELVSRELAAPPKPDGVLFQTCLLHKNGSPVDVEVIGRVLHDEKTGRPASLQGTTRDIRRRLETERELAESRAQLKRAVEQAPFPVFIHAEDGRILYLSAAVSKITGYSVESLPTIEEWVRRAYPENRDTVQDIIRRLFAIEEPVNEGDFRVRCADGSERIWVFESAPLGRLPDGRRLVMSMAADVTERKRSEEENRKSRSLLEQAERFTHTGSWEWDIAAERISFSDEWMRIHGVSERSLPIDALIDIAHPDDRERIERAFRDTLKRGVPYQIEHRILRQSDGEERIVNAGGRVVHRDASGAPLTAYGTAQDVTDTRLADRDRTQLENQLRQSQKMESVGRLAGGVAHDFNNILQTITGYSDLLLEAVPEDDSRHEFVDEISRSAARAAQLTRQLLAFGRRQVLKKEDLDLNDVVGSMMKMLSRLIGEHIRIDFVAGHRLGNVYADRGQMEQVLMNLCVNARDAMPDGGILTLETENVLVNGEYLRHHPWAKPGRFVLLSVTDTGIGMDAETLSKIFEPFYTTKEAGKGTGLGLATVYGIVQQHEGMIHPYSEPGKGTAFKIYLPLFSRPAATRAPRVKGAPPRGNETILLAEDDPSVRALTRRILERAGYDVHTAENGVEALRVFEEQGGRFHLALLDVVMPEMGGRGVYDRLRKKYPHLRFLFSSGYSTNSIHKNFVLEDGFELISKPFSPDVLLRKIREILDRPG